MGCFSNCCAKTNLPVLMHDAWGKDVPRLTHIVVLERGQKPFTAEYDGYGMHLEEFDDAKLVLADVYNGERWEDLSESRYEPNQGIFHSKEFVVGIASLPNGFPTYDDYFDALRDFENELEECITAAFATLDIPPPESMQMHMQEYFGYVLQRSWDLARFYLDRHHDLLDWLPSSQEDQLEQAQKFQQVLDASAKALTDKILEKYRT